MSRPRYMLHRNSTLSIVVDVENLITYIYQITNNEKQFPKTYRYTLVSDLRNTCLDLYKNIYKAISINLRHKKDLKRKQKFQKKVYENISSILYIYRLLQKQIPSLKWEGIKNLWYAQTSP